MKCIIKYILVGIGDKCQTTIIPCNFLFDERIEKDEYFESTICNIYFDSASNDLLIRSIDKPLYKMKIRLRSYGIPRKKDDVFLEIKLKYKDIVGKRRIKLKLGDFYNYMNKGIYDSNNQIMKEVNYFF